MTFSIHIVLIVSLCFGCISKAASDDSASRLRSLMNSLSVRRRLKPLSRNSDGKSLESVILLDEQAMLDQDTNETFMAEDQRMGDYDDDDDDDDEKELSNQFSLSMSYSLTVSKTAKSKSGKTSKKSSKATSDSTKAPKSAKTTSKKSKSSKGSPSEPDTPGTSPIPEPDDDPWSRSAKKSKKGRKSIKKGVQSRIYEGRYVQTMDYKKSCTSFGSCQQSNSAYCKGGMDVVQEFSVTDFGNIIIHLDIAWDFAGRPSKCTPVSRKEETLVGLGWLPMVSNSYACYTDHVYRIPKSPNVNEQVFTSTFEVTMPDGQVLDGQILSGAICELYTESDIYLEMNSYVIAALIPGYSVYVKYDIDERTMQVMDVLTGKPQVTIQQYDASPSGYEDSLRPDISILQGI